MDSSRDEDLKRLKSVFENPNKSKFVRNQAHTSLQSILRQIKDRKLTSMRQRLIGAIRAEDETETARIQEQIKEYSYRQGYKA